MAKRKADLASASGQPPGGALKKENDLTFKQQRFVEEYVRHRGNGTQAYLAAFGYNKKVTTARTEAPKLLAKPCIREAIEERKAHLARLADTSLLEMLAPLLAQATANPGDFTQVMKQPIKQKNYKPLGDKALALTLSRSDGEHGTNYDLRLPTASERQKAACAVIEILGLGVKTNKRDRKSNLGKLSGLSSVLGREGSDGGS